MQIRSFNEGQLEDNEKHGMDDAFKHIQCNLIHVVKFRIETDLTQYEWGKRED